MWLAGGIGAAARRVGGGPSAVQWPRDVRIEFFTAPDPAFVDDTFARFVDEFLLAPFAPAGRSGEKEAR
ncbi:hypothetical protein A5664_00460 [Mycolicibacterium fortuitum]|nr:hypothetical protein A5669_02635 [Mycolicibacterium fortuitum]OBI70600.1 hypothetical protein A5664_00460 [Mycolicibacterium fortuitum]